MRRFLQMVMLCFMASSANAALVTSGNFVATQLANGQWLWTVKDPMVTANYAYNVLGVVDTNIGGGVNPQDGRFSAGPLTSIYGSLASTGFLGYHDWVSPNVVIDNFSGTVTGDIKTLYDAGWRYVDPNSTTGSTAVWGTSYSVFAPSIPGTGNRLAFGVGTYLGGSYFRTDGVSFREFLAPVRLSNVAPTAVPLPASIMLFVSGLTGMLMRRNTV